MNQIFQFCERYGTWAYVILVAIVIASMSLHEVAHAWVAWKRGDSTAKDLGRITLNPLAHISLVITIIVPIVSLLLIGIPFGGAKPVPVDFSRLKKPYFDMALVAIAGPLSNILLAIGGGVVFHALVNVTKSIEPVSFPSHLVVVWISTNLYLAAFNLLPLPPLDGSRVLNFFLPPPLRPIFRRLDLIGVVVLLLLFFYYPPLGGWILAIQDRLFDLNFAIVTLGGLW